MSEPSASTPIPTADVVFINGTVITVNGQNEVTEALAIRRGRILRVGARSYVEIAVALSSPVFLITTST
ncbi:MAG: hypothetical protein HYY46_10235 [Deltaproteobacteria bacterium]|nr:hypothetical protein [Deltaproteobacteria bacterium]